MRNSAYEVVFNALFRRTHGSQVMILQRRGCFHRTGPLYTTARPPEILREKQDPMVKLTNIFRTYPSCLHMHRELTICLANGDGERAADLASVLAENIKRLSKQEKEELKKETGNLSSVITPGSLDGKAENVSNGYMPAAGPKDIEFAVEKTRRGLIDNKADNIADTFIEGDDGIAPSTRSYTNTSVELPFWKQPSALRVTLLETSFELTLPEGVDSDNPLSRKGAEVEEHEKEQMALLDDYLTREKKRWEAQKASIGRVVVTTAQRLGLTPEDLHSALEENNVNMTHSTGQDGRLRLLKHCNLIVRGEVPEMGLLSKGAAEDMHKAEEELDVLARRMEKRGTPLTPREREMALFELIMTKSKMRYVVGLHRELQIALNGSKALMQQTVQQKVSSGSELFSQKVVEELNKVVPDVAEASAEDLELVESLSAPVLPFTFMLKMCLWFDIPQDLRHNA